MMHHKNETQRRESKLNVMKVNLLLGPLQVCWTVLVLCTMADDYLRRLQSADH